VKTKKIKSTIKLLVSSNPALPMEIGVYWHCAKCLAERPKGQSQQEYARCQLGDHPQGLQLICVRHNCNIAIITPQLVAA
jgi:hypothetical protein